MKAQIAFLGLAAILASNTAQAIDLSGLWTSTDYTCLSGKTYNELFRVSDDGINYQAVKIVGDECVTAGSVSFFGTRSSTSPVCHVVLGNQGSPSSSLGDCSLTIVDTNTIQVYGSTLKRFKQSGKSTGVTVTKVDCKNVTTNSAIVPGNRYDNNSSWSCDKLPMKTGDTIVQTVTGKVQ
jgi:hypothetical protein